jgi:hypothetical protein
VRYELCPGPYARLAVKNGAFLLIISHRMGWVISTGIWVITTPDCQDTKLVAFGKNCHD